eukprot:TRINITY_DN5756_c0_g1_i1.p1 TRINITY_DN5756_c0_g1~~TRINITY_DN5756_c0_g1_i1.p1  ORF type:complete len:221 (-),score=61.93 TRINITY_DN5756_c0_g1_i1:540-1202(-)
MSAAAMWRPMRHVPAAAGHELGSFLARFSMLPNLSLKRCPQLFTAEGLDGLHGGLGDAKLHLLRSLDLDDCAIEPAQAEGLGRLLARCPKLEELKLWSNPGLLTTDGLAGLQRGLGEAELPNLRQLHLGCCDIQASAAEGLGAVLAKSSQLHILSLSMNRFLMTSEGLRGLEKGLKSAGSEGLPELRELLLYRTFNTKSEDALANIRQRIGLSPECVLRA